MVSGGQPYITIIIISCRSNSKSNDGLFRWPLSDHCLSRSDQVWGRVASLQVVLLLIRLRRPIATPRSFPASFGGDKRVDYDTVIKCRTRHFITHDVVVCRSCVVLQCIVERDFGWFRFGFCKEYGKIVCNFRRMILLLIQCITVLGPTNVKAAVSGKCRIPVQVVSPTVQAKD